MNDEQAFIDALTANPYDGFLLAVSADWLDDRGENDDHERAARYRLASKHYDAIRVMGYRPRYARNNQPGGVGGVWLSTSGNRGCYEWWYRNRDDDSVEYKYRPPHDWFDLIECDHNYFGFTDGKKVIHSRDFHTEWEAVYAACLAFSKLSEKRRGEIIKGQIGVPK